MADETSDRFERIMDPNDPIRLSASSRPLRTDCLKVLPIEKLSDAIKFILQNNPYPKNAQNFTEKQEEILEKLRENPQTMFERLHTDFALYLDIDLHILACVNGTFDIIKGDHQKERVAFLLFKEDNSVHGPLFTIGVNGAYETVFSANNNADIYLNEFLFLISLGAEGSSSDLAHAQEQHLVNCVQETIESEPIINKVVSRNDMNSSMDERAYSRHLLHQTLEQVFQLIDDLPISPDAIRQKLEQFVHHLPASESLSSEEKILAAKDGIERVWQLVHDEEQPALIQSNEANDEPHHIETTMAEDLPIFNADLSFTIHPNSQLESLVNITERYALPRLRKNLQSTFHPRTMNEFAKSGSARLRCIRSGQRDPIWINLPPPDENTLHLSIEAVDLAKISHLSKIIVPDKTKAKNSTLINNNDLGCLVFDECSEGDKFNLHTRCLHMKISSTDRTAGKKGVRVHMISLFQRNEINRTVMQDQSLKQHMVAFWFSLFENEEYTRVSPILYSDIITDSVKKMSEKKIGDKKPKRLRNTRIGGHTVV